MNNALRESPPADALCLRVLGTPDFQGAGADVANAVVAQPMRLALLAYLATMRPRGFRRREELLTLLWPDSDASRARNSLRQSLHVLRQLLPAGAILTRGSTDVALSATSFTLDVELFEEHLDHGREAAALALYRGELLHHFHVPDCREFEFWLDGERERLRRRMVRGALVLANRQEDDGDVVRAAESARTAIEHAPFDEDVLHDVVALFDRLGDRVGAARIHSAAVARFQEELGLTLAPLGEHGLEGRRLHEVLVQPIRRSSATVHASELRQASHSTGNARQVPAEARRSYLEARQFSAQRSPATIVRAIEGYTKAIRLAPDYAEAHAGLAFALAQATVYVGYPGIDTWPRVKTHAAKATRIDPMLGEAHALHAQATLCYDYDWTTAGQLYRHAIAVDSVSDVPRQSYAQYFLTASGRTDEALELLDRTRDSMPNAPGVSTFFAMSCVFGRQFERARIESAAVIELQPAFNQAYWVQGMALEGLGEARAAIKAFETGLALTNGSTLFLSQLGRSCARAGEHARARDILAELKRRDERAGPGMYFVAEIHAALGDVDTAIDALYAAYRQRNPLMVFVGVMYALDPLREHRRFRDLLMRLGIRRHERAA